MNKRNMPLIVVIIVILILAGAYFGLNNQKNSETIKIGVIGTLTGAGAFQGQEEVRGIQIAVDEINSNGGINGKKIEIIVEDSGTAAQKAVDAFNKLTEVDGAKYIIGDSWAATTVGLVPMANQKGIILLSPATGLDQLTAEDMFLRTIPTTDSVMRALAEYAYTSMGSRKVGIIYQDNAYGSEHTTDFTKYFTALGGEISGVEKIAMTQTDMHSELSKLWVNTPDTILNLHATGAMQGIPLRQAEELGIKVKWIGSYGTENTPLVTQYENNLTNGFTYPYFYDLNSNDSAIKSFITKYRTDYNAVPTFSTVNSYDALKLIALSIQVVGDDPLKVKDYMLTVKDYHGASGTFSFDKFGDVQKHIFIKQIMNGMFVRLTE